MCGSPTIFSPRLQLDHAHAQRRADDCGQPGAIGVHHAAIGTRRWRVFLPLPALAHAHGFERCCRQRHIRLWVGSLSARSTWSTGRGELRLHIRRQTAGIFQSPQLSAEVVLLQKRRNAHWAGCAGAHLIRLAAAAASIGSIHSEPERGMTIRDDSISFLLSELVSENLCPTRVGDVNAERIDASLALILGRIERNREVSFPAIRRFDAFRTDRALFPPIRLHRCGRWWEERISLRPRPSRFRRA